MNLPKNNFNCPIIDNCVPANADEIAAELCHLYYKGEIYDNMPEYEMNKYINMIKDKLAEKGHDDEFVKSIKSTYRDNIFAENHKSDVISDEEEQKILNEFSKNK
jgi:hypothetical protein